MMVIEDAVEYNDYVIKQQDNIGNELKIFIAILNDTESIKSSAVSELDNVKDVINQSIRNLNNLQTLDPDFEMKENAVNLFNFYKRTMENAYVEMVDEIYSESPDGDRMNEIISKITEDEAIYDNAFLGAQQDFADYYNIRLE